MAINADGAGNKLIVFLWLFSKYFAHKVIRFYKRAAIIEGRE
ncbi:hypothetical protein THF1A12_250107 [Vibrio jasicida]|uniref:DUF3265 domain-containing protein n=1 Tax=Vibrio jasicida TaxID=766224 RepID=A0AAU9QNZ6_9VIBR|nr:hypothetical protein THF1A12_250107 [Vibrio jasicida]